MRVSLNLVFFSILLGFNFSTLFAVNCPGFFGFMDDHENVVLESKNYPQTESVVQIKMQDNLSRIWNQKKFDSSDPKVLEELYYRLFYRFKHSSGFDQKPIVMSNESSDLDRIRTVIKDQIFYRLFSFYKDSPYYRWFSIDDSSDYDPELISAFSTSLTSSFNWRIFMKVFTEILNTKPVQNLSLISYDASYLDWSYPVENYIQGLDHSIELLVDLIYFSAEAKDSRQYKSYHTISTKKFVKEQRMIVMKKIIAMFSLSLFDLYNRYEAELNASTDANQYWINDGKCSGVVVSSNTVITSAQCLKGLIPSDRVEIEVNGKTIHSVAYYVNPYYLVQNVSKKFSSPEDIAVIRFPDGSFSDLRPAKIGFWGVSKKAYPVLTDFYLGKKFVYEIDQSTKDSVTFSSNSYQPYTQNEFYDYGSPIFNEFGEFVALSRGKIQVYSRKNIYSDFKLVKYPIYTMNKEPEATYKFNIDACPFTGPTIKFFFRMVTLLDPKVKIRGFNQD